MADTCYQCGREMLTTTTQCGCIWVVCVDCVGRLYGAPIKPLVAINMILHTAYRLNEQQERR